MVSGMLLESCNERSELSMLLFYCYDVQSRSRLRGRIIFGLFLFFLPSMATSILPTFSQLLI